MRKKSKKPKNRQLLSRSIKNIEDETETICQALEKLLRKETRLESIDVSRVIKVYRRLKKRLKRKPTVEELVKAVDTKPRGSKGF